MDRSETHKDLTRYSVTEARRGRASGAFAIAVSVIGLALAAWLAVETRRHSGGIPSWDRDISVWMHSRRSPLLTALALFLAAMGSLAMMGLLAVAGFVAARYRPERWARGRVLTLGALGAWGLIEGVKFLVQRPRPSFFPPLIQTGGYSFPSGHALFGIAVYGLLAHMLLPRIRSRSARILLAFLTAVLVIAIGLSRVYLGVHYPSDVLAGWCLGIPWLFLCIEIHDASARRRRKA